MRVPYGVHVSYVETSEDDRRGRAHHEVPDPLRNDVRLLGGLLGTVLREAGGDELLADVERLRELTIRAHDDEEEDASFAEAQALVETFSPERAEQVARAFTCYFHLANLAEEYHRVRVLRERESTRDPDEVAGDDSFAAAVTELTEEIGREATLERLRALEFRPVVTAHPTEARRRAVSSAIRRISALVAERDGAHVGGTSLAENERRLLAEIDVLWRTSPLRAAKPTVVDEIRTVMGVFDSTFFETFPEVYRRFDDWLQGDQAGARAPIVRPFRPARHMDRWRPGREPNVTAEVTRSAALIASEHVLTALEEAARRTGNALTLDGSATPASADLVSLWRRQRVLSEPLTARIAGESPNEPHRQVLLVVAERIAATRLRDADLAYADAAEAEADLVVVQESLVQARASRAGYGDLQRLIWQVQTFGFHLAELEVRQHSIVHEQALADIAANGIDGPLAEKTTEVLDTFRALGAVQHRHGTDAARRYIVSFTQKAEHLEAVYQLAALVFDDPEHAPVIDAIPLFETFADLEASVEILEGMLLVPAVQARLAANGRRVEVMLGYSDSSKDVGPVAATLALDVAQSKITQWAKRNDITFDALPRSRRRPRSRGRPGEPCAPRTTCGVGRRSVQAHGAGRGHLRPLRGPGHRCAAHRAGRRSDAPRQCSVDRAS